eukprot:9062513-Heterocapsa_arctica.AAC.1
MTDEILKVTADAGWRGDEHGRSMSVGVCEAKLVQLWLAEFGIKLMIYLRLDSSSARAVMPRRGLSKLCHIALASYG